MKKFILLMLLFLLVTFSCYAQESSYLWTINGKIQHTTSPILEQDGQIYLSLQDCLSFIHHDYTLCFNEKDLAVTLMIEKQYSYFSKGHLYAVMNNRLVALPAPPLYEQGQFYLPASICAKLTGHYFIKSKSYLQFFKF